MVTIYHLSIEEIRIIADMMVKSPAVNCTKRCSSICIGCSMIILSCLDSQYGGYSKSILQQASSSWTVFHNKHNDPRILTQQYKGVFGPHFIPFPNIADAPNQRYFGKSSFDKGQTLTWEFLDFFHRTYPSSV